MKNTGTEIRSHVNNNIFITVIPGHFVTSHSHINYYVDITRMKHQLALAREAAKTLSEEFRYSTVADTIVCMDGSELIGGFLAAELANPDMLSLNRNKNINIVTPEFNSNGQMMFRDNIQPMVEGKNILLLIASVTTGKTIHRCLECIQYYGGITSGIAAVFSAIPEAEGIPIHALFTREDVPNYSSYSYRDCPKCKEHQKIDALANSYGYSEI